MGSFGADVVLLEALIASCPMDSQIAKESAKIFKTGVGGCSARVTGTEVIDEAVHVTYQDGEEEKQEVFDRLIVCVGRRPLIAGLVAGDASVAMDEQGFIFVNDQCATEVPGVWAIGDIVRGPMLAHGVLKGVMVAERVSVNHAA